MSFRIAFFWPWSAERYFAPIRVIEVAPLSLSSLLTALGAAVMLSELLWVWLPGVFIGFGFYLTKGIIALIMASIRSPVDFPGG